MQIDFFSVGCNTPYKITKPIRLIELFAGIGSQSKALERLQANFEHYRICEFDKYAAQSYNAIHGTNFKPTDITKITADDIGITETDKYEYIMTYSFPCTDLSVAGKQAGMAKGSGTRSGLLWEVERLLTECKELPQVLLMENVPQVLNGDFGGWLDFLDGLGYRNYYKCLNAKNYGIPQNRNRCFMVSVLGDYYYDFPKAVPLQLRLKDMLESKVDEKYYLKLSQFQNIKLNKSDVKVGVMLSNKGKTFEKETDISGTLLARDYKGFGNQSMTGVMEKCQQVADINHYKNDQMNRVYSGNGIAPTVETMSGGGREPKVLEPQLVGGVGDINFGKQYRQGNRIYDSQAIACALNASPVGNAGGESYLYKVDDPLLYDAYNKREIKSGVCGTLTAHGNTSNTHCGTFFVSSPSYRIRKLTPLECYRLMGFDDADFYKAKAAGVSDSQLYKQAGNSIVVNVLEAIFKQLF